MFSKAKWIWHPDYDTSDTYIEFFASCECKNSQEAVLRIAADSDYAVFINGNFVASGQYMDYPHNRAYDEIDISKYLVSGVNTFGFCIWYIGESNFMYSHGEPGLIYEVDSGGEILLYSDKNTFCRKSKRYISGRKQWITPQLGYGFCLDMTKDFIGESFNRNDLINSAEKPSMPLPAHLRENKKLILNDRVDTEIVCQGAYSFISDDGTDGSKMQRALLSFCPFDEMAKNDGSSTVFTLNNGNVFLIFDLKSENAGFLDFDIETDKECKAVIGWGEHLCDGRCRTEIEYRDFSSVIHLKRGRNTFLQPLRRLGLRYLQIFIESSKVKINYLGIRPTEYPLEVLPFSTGNLLRNTIYDVSVRTLRLCMHEHYEDCPWREQSLYTLDSRNQMLCGYYAFKEYEFPRSSLRLIAAGIREDGLFPITAPTDCNLTIPFFSLIYLVQVWEYYQHSNDIETVKYCFPAMEKVVKTFLSRIDENRLIPNFDGEEYWNFYEWQPYLDGETYKDTKYDLCINAAFSYVLDSYINCCLLLNRPVDKYAETKKELNKTIKDKFFDNEKGLFRLCLTHDEDKISALGNALCVLCGATDNLDTTAIELLLKDNGEGEIKGIPSTLSMFLYRYDALLKINKEKYADLILNDIDKTYLYMLRNGATSFWETIKGEADFDDAGSLCHGWSALPVYYYHKLIRNDFP